MDEQLEFERCLMVLLAVVLGVVIVLQFALLLKACEIRQEQEAQRKLVNALVDYTLSNDSEFSRRYRNEEEKEK